MHSFAPFSNLNLACHGPRPFLGVEFFIKFVDDGSGGGLFWRHSFEQNGSDFGSFELDEKLFSRKKDLQKVLN